MDTAKSPTQPTTAHRPPHSSSHSAPANPTPSTTKHTPPVLAIVVTSVVVILALFFGIQLFLKKDAFHQPGQIIFDDTASEANRDFINDNLGNLQLDSDVTIGASSATSMPNLELIQDTIFIQASEESTPVSINVLYNILLPVTTPDSGQINVSVADAENSNLLSIWDLNANYKLLELDHKYYLDDFANGAFFEYFTIRGNYADVIKVRDLIQSKIATLPTSDTVLTLAQTGVTALSRRMNTRLQQVKDPHYFAQNIGPFLSGFDLTHTSNESSFSNLANGSNICSLPDMITVLQDIGLDIVELTGNHNQDCGDQSAIDTINKYQALGIKTFGGGIDTTSAAIPLEITQKDTHITMLGYNLSTGGYTTDQSPGANYYTLEKAQQDIADAKARGDFIIVDIQYYECNSYVNTAEDTTCDYADSAAGDQVEFFRSLIDMGADVVVGTSAHQPQAYESYHDGMIYYGLGNLFFDQSAWPGTTRSLILVHYFWQGKLLQTRLLATQYDESFQTWLMDTANTEQFLQRLLSARPAQ